jgi:hypothetical protein
MKLKKLGGFASIALVCLQIVMRVVLTIAFHGSPRLADIYNPAWMIPAYQAAPAAFWAYYVMGILTAILTLLIVLALEERMKADAPCLMRLAVIAASAYAALTITTQIGGFFRNVLLLRMNDMSAFRAFLVLHEFLTVAAVSLLGWGFLLIGCAALKTHALPRILGYIILVFGVGSIIQFVFTVLHFGLEGFITSSLGFVVYVSLGVVLVRRPKQVPAQT